MLSQINCRSRKSKIGGPAKVFVGTDDCPNRALGAHARGTTIDDLKSLKRSAYVHGPLEPNERYEGSSAVRGGSWTSTWH